MLPRWPLFSSSAAGEWCVFSFDLDLPSPEIAALRGLLSEDEIQRADRFVLPHHGSRFVAGHGQLRQILGRWLDTKPAALRFRFGPHGKPQLIGSHLQFNLSGSAAVGLLAVHPTAEVGVDVEQLRAMPDARQIVERFFTESEKTALARLTDDELQNAFFQIWTRKEAVVKSRGGTLGQALSGVDVPPHWVSETVPAVAVSAPPGCLSLFHLEPAHGYLGALAASQALPPPACWQWRAGSHT